MICLHLKFVVEVYSFVNYLCDFVSILVWVERYEKCAVINEFTNEVLDVFFENSKVHSCIN